MLFAISVGAKEWRGVVPLETTRSDVERVLGKPNKLGRYQFKNESADIRYAEGACTAPYQNLRVDKCECLVARDAVRSVRVTVKGKRSFSALNIDKSTFEKRLVQRGSSTYDYHDRTNGVIYRVDERRDQITSIEYLPSSKRCQEVIQQTEGKPRNVWRGLLPLHSTRSDVERLIGQAKDSFDSRYFYSFATENVSFRYAKGNCRDDSGWNVPADAVLEIRVVPLTEVLLGEAELAPRYSRVESRHPANMFYHFDWENGVTVTTRVLADIERLDNIKYEGSARDVKLACPLP